MSTQVLEATNANVMEVRISDRLTAEDYQQFVPELERRIEQQGMLRLLVIMEDFHGWTAGALWEDVKFDARHFSDIERLALVGEKAWQKGMAVFCKPFTSAEVRYYEHDEMERARQWVAES